MNPVDIAKSLATEIETAGQSAEIECRMPQALAQTMSEAGLFRQLVPEIYGGLQCHPQTYFDTLAATAEADGAMAWCLMIGSSTGMLSASLPAASAASIYADNPNVITVGVTAPIGKAVRVGDDLQVSGRWPFGSGSQIADWICGGCMVYDQKGQVQTNENGQPEPLLVFFRAEDVTIHTDSWDTSGLRGTGSHDFSVADVMVPKGHWVVLGKRAQVDAPLYRFPTFGLLALGVSAVSIGIAQRAITEFLILADTKMPTGSSQALANRPLVQRDIAQAHANLASARALTKEYIDEAWQEASAQGRLTTEVKAHLRLAASNNAWTAVEIVDTLYHAAGGTSIYKKSKLQQCFRDVHVPTQHIMVAQPTYEIIGRVLMGQETKQPL